MVSSASGNQTGAGIQTKLTEMERQQISTNDLEQSSEGRGAPNPTAEHGIANTVSNEQVNYTLILQTNPPSDDNDPLTAAEADSLPTGTEPTQTVDDFAIMIRPPIQEESEINAQWDEFKNFKEDELCMANKAL